MATESKKIAIERDDIGSVMADPLRTIDEDTCTDLASAGNDRLDVMYGPERIGDMLNGDHSRFGGQQLIELAQVEFTPGSDWEHAHPRATQDQRTDRRRLIAPTATDHVRWPSRWLAARTRRWRPALPGFANLVRPGPTTCPSPAVLPHPASLR